MKLDRSFRYFLIFVISFEIAVGPHFLHLAKAGEGAPDSPGQQDVARILGETAAGEPAIQKLSRLANDIEAGRPIQWDDSDFRRRANQVVRVYGEPTNGGKGPIVGSFRPADPLVEAKKIAFTSINFRAEGSDFIIEGLIGADAQGKNGAVVADLVIPDLEVVAFEQDKELVTLVERNGRVRVLYLGEVFERLFQGPITDYTVYQPEHPVDFKNYQNLKLENITPGVQAVAEGELRALGMLPVRADGQMSVDFGDAILRGTNADGKTEVLAYYSREVMYRLIGARALLDAAQAAQLRPTQDNTDLYISQIEEALKKEQLAEHVIPGEALSELQRSVYDRFGIKDLTTLLEAYGQLKKFSVTGREENFKAARGQATVEEWQKLNAELAATVERAKKLGIDTSNLDLQRDWKKLIAQSRHADFGLGKQDKLEAKALAEWRSKLSEAERAQGMSQLEHDALMNRAENHEGLNGEADSDSVSRLKKAKHFALAAMRQSGKLYRENKILVWLLGTSAVVGTLPLAVDYSGLKAQFQSVEAVYQYVFPLLWNTLHRVPVLISTFALLMFYPITILSSISAGKFISKMAKKYEDKDKNSAEARKWRELDKIWGSHRATWGRLTLVGVRVYAFFILSIFTRIARWSRNPSLVAAVVNDLKVSHKILKEGAQPGPLHRVSEAVFEHFGVGGSLLADMNRKYQLGLDLGRLTEANDSIRLGLADPFKPEEMRGRDEIVRAKARSLLLLQRQRSENLASVMAALVVSGKTGIDVGTLMYYLEHGVSSETLSDINSSGRKQRSHKVIADTYAQMLAEMQAVDIDPAKEINPEVLMKAYESLREVGRKLTQEAPQWKINFQLLNLKFAETVKEAKAKIFNLGERNEKFLKAIIPSKNVQNMVSTQFSLDYPWSTIQTAFPAGPRTNLDKPHELSAGADFPWYAFKTNPAHLNEQWQQVLIYVIIATSRYTMNYDTLKAEADSVYAPVEAIRLGSRQNQEGFIPGFKSMFSNAVNFEESNAGGKVIQEQINKTDTIQAGIALDMVGRLGIAGQALNPAIQGYFFNYLWSPFAASIFWQMLARGGMMTEEAVEKNLKLIQSAMKKITDALESTASNRTELLQEGYNGLLDLYTSGMEPVRKNGAMLRLSRLLKGRNPFHEPRQPKPFEQAKALLKKSGYDSLLKSHEELEKQGLGFWGLVGDLALAVASKNEAEEFRLSSELKKILANESSLPREEINAMEARSLLRFATYVAPLPTAVNHTANESWTLGMAFATTFTLTLLQVLTFRQLGWGTIGTSAALTFGIGWPAVWYYMTTSGRQFASTWRDSLATSLGRNLITRVPINALSRMFLGENILNHGYSALSLAPTPKQLLWDPVFYGRNSELSIKQNQEAREARGKSSAVNSCQGLF